MTISFFLKLYLLTVPVFFVIDLLWLGVVAKNFYRKNLGYILSPNVNWTAAIVFYLIYIVGILIFAVLPGIAKDSLRHAALWGALFGFFTYTTYELTNLALLKDWPMNIVFVDILWGVILCWLVATGSFFIARPPYKFIRNLHELEPISRISSIHRHRYCIIASVRGQKGKWCSPG